MHSLTPKPLHRLCGRPMVLHVLDALAELPIDRVVIVVGYRGLEVSKTIEAEARPGFRLEFVEQSRPLGTGDAVAVALTGFAAGADLGEGDLVVLPGDTPLLRPPTLAALVRAHREGDAAATMLTARLADARGYGRVVRGRDDKIARVVEDVDCDEQERAIDEVNTSIYCFRHNVLAPTLRRLSPSNAQGEYYLTDAIEVLATAGYSVTSLILSDPMEAAGVNDRAQLAAAEAELRGRINERFMRRGVTMLDPDSTYIEASVEIDNDVTLLPGVILAGRTVVGEGALIGPRTQLIDTRVAPGARVLESIAEQSSIDEGAVVGPYAVLEPGSHVRAQTVTGPYFRAPAGEGT